MRESILIVGYNTQLSRCIASHLSEKKVGNSFFLQDGTRIIPLTWFGTYQDFCELNLDGHRFDQVFIADDSRMKIMRKVMPLLPALYASCLHSDIPVEFQISVLNTDTWDSDFIENWFGLKTFRTEICD